MYNAKQNTQATKKPHFIAYVVSDNPNENDRAFWTRIGTMFSHKDGEGFDLLLKASPLTTRVVIRKPKPKQD